MANLTDLTVQRLRPFEDEYVVGDRKSPGLALRVWPSGCKTFVFQYRFQGRQHKVKLGRYPQISLKDARGLASQMHRQIALGDNPAQVAKQKKLLFTTTSLTKVIDLYVGEHL